ncbi:hypothetical protein FQN49_002585 [Arthroderma sp. PD_2]|nr:hypothetical protein FQN49_002585 [Arthroderma sp. PD_2]
MELNQVTWESLLSMDDQTVGVNNQPGLRRSLLPAPLRIGSASTSPSQYQAPSPPLSPAPTLLVSVQAAEHTRSMSGKLSLHEYRRKLSHPDVESGTTAAPRRRLKRKPKAVNLNSRQGNTIPLSPPATPPLQVSFVPSPPISPDLISEHRTFSPGYSNASNLSRSCDVSPINENFLDIVRTTPQDNLTHNHSYEASTYNKPQYRALTTLRDSIRHIPARFTTHTKSASEPALPRTLRHRGVSFEILSPPKRTDSAMSQSSNGTASPVKSYTPTPLTNEIPPRSNTPPPKIHRRSASLGAERRCTPSRALFEDLPTAYSSITSGVSNKNKHVHPSLDTACSDEHPPRCSAEDTAADYQAVLSDAEPSTPQEENADVVEANIPRPVAKQRTLGEIPTVQESLYEAPQPCHPVRKTNKLVKRHLYATSDHSPGCPRIRPIISTFLNRRQPNLHGARGRIEKPKTIRDIINGSGNAQSASSLDDIEQQFQAASALHSPQPEPAQSPPDNHASRFPGALASHSLEATDEDEIRIPEEIYSESPALQPGGFSPEDSKRLAEWKSFILTGSTDHVASEELPRNLQRTSIFGPNFSRPMSSSRSQHRKSNRRGDRRLRLSYSASSMDGPHSGLPRLSAPSLRYSGKQKELSNFSLSPSQPVSPIEDETVTGVGSCSADYMGPGSSRNSSIHRLSQHTASSMALRSPQRPKSILPFEPIERKGYHPFFHAHLGSQRSNMKRGGNSTSTADRKRKESINTILDGDSDIEEGGGVSEKDWETVTESQMFNTRSRNPISHLESGSSLANYSSAGSLANGGLIDIPSQSSLQGRGLQSTLSNRSHRFRKPSWMKTSRQRRIPEISAPSFPRHLYSMSELPRDPEVLYSTAPPLMASTMQHPAPRAASYSHYQHPTPLREPHANPFRSTPPPLIEQTSGNHGKAGREKSGFVSAIRSSKFNFQDNDNNPFNSGPSAGPIRSLHPLPARASMRSSAWWTESSMNKMQSQRSFHNAPFSSSARGVGDISPFHTRNLSNHHQTSTTDNISATDIISSKTPLPVTSHTTRASSLAPRTPHAINHDIELDTLTRTRHRSIPARSRVRSFGSSLVSGNSTSRHPPGSLYHSIRSARDRALNHRHNRTLTNNSTSTTNEQLLAARPDTPASSRGASPHDFTMDYEPRAERVSSPRSLFGITPSIPSRPPTRSQSAATSRKPRSPKPDDILRERLEQIETASIVLSNHSPSMHDSCVRSPWTTCQPARQFTISHGASSFFATIDEEAAIIPSDAYCSTYGRHVFPEPPRLTPQPYRGPRPQQHQRGDSSGSTGGTVPGGSNLSAQRRMGRQLILLLSLVVPFGWFVVAYIGFEGKLADSLIRWRSNGAISEFHAKEKYWASQLAVSYAVFTLIVVLVVLTICLTAL